MDLIQVLRLLTDDTRQTLASLAYNGPIANKGASLRQLSALFQGLAICTLLVDADVGRFRANLVRGAHARRYHLRKAHDERGVDDRFLGLSKTDAVFDAVVAGAPELVQEITRLSTDTWHPAWEYEDDYCYLSFVHCMLTQRGFLADSASAALLLRFDRALEGQRSTRLGLCRTLRESDGPAFREAFESFLHERKVGLDARRSRITEYTAQALFWPQSFVSVEALAWLAFARGAGLPMDDDFLFCPRAARDLTPPAPRVDDLCEQLDEALLADAKPA